MCVCVWCLSSWKWVQHPSWTNYRIIFLYHLLLLSLPPSLFLSLNLSLIQTPTHNTFEGDKCANCIILIMLRVSKPFQWRFLLIKLIKWNRWFSSKEPLCSCEDRASSVLQPLLSTRTVEHHSIWAEVVLNQLIKSVCGQNITSSLNLFKTVPSPPYSHTHSFSVQFSMLLWHKCSI